MANYGAKISKAGYDVKTATPVQLIFSSEFNTMKVVVDGSATETGDQYDTKTKEITHSLGYVPAWLIYFKSSAGTYYKWQQGSNGGISGDSGVKDLNISVSTTKIYVKIWFQEDNETVTIYYTLFANQITT